MALQWLKALGKGITLAMQTPYFAEVDETSLPSKANALLREGAIIQASQFKVTDMGARRE